MAVMYILTIAVLDGSNNAQTLRFTDGDYIDGSANFYEPRLLQPASIVVSPNDGGLFNLFKSASIGDIELANMDGGLDYLANYAIDGRTLTLSLVDGATVTTVLTGTVDKMQENKGIVSLTVKSLTEALSSTHPQDTYLGTNSGGIGLEGTADDISGDLKPKVFGLCRNVTPVLVNDSLLIYEASSRSDAVIIAVYDDGIRLTDYLVNGAKSIGATSINVDTGVGAIPTGSHVMFSGHLTIYTVATGLSGGVIVLSSGLTAAIADNAVVEVLNIYTGSGTGAGQLQGTIATGNSWGSYNGYFRLATTPSKLITCDVMSVTSYVADKSGNVFSKIATEISVTVDSASVTTLNSIGTYGFVGIFLNNETPSRELFDKIVRSYCGYYYYIGSTLYFNQLASPNSGASVMTIEAWQVASIERMAIGCGSNGVPIYWANIKCEKYETIQQTVAGGVSKSLAAKLAKGFRTTKAKDTAVLTRHPLSERLEIDSFLMFISDAQTVVNAVLPIIKVRRDIVDIIANFSQVPAFTIGNTLLLKHETLGYVSGRYMVIIGYELDIKKKQVVLRLFG
jgi:hypothetical protein